MTPIQARSVGLSSLVGASLIMLTSGASFAQTPPPASPAPAYAPPPGAPPGTYAPPPGAPPSTYGAAPVLATPPERANSINGNPFGFLVGSYSLNYERLVNGTHGFLVEGNFGLTEGTTTTNGQANKSTSTNYGGGAGYRWHWSGRQQSGFLGLMAGYTVGSGTGTLTSGAMSKSFDLKIKAPWVVANIGKRWQWDNGLNITFRIGAGWAQYTVSTSSMDPDAQAVKDFMQDILTLLPIAFDGELSLGYTF